MKKEVIKFDHLGWNIGTRFAAAPIREKIETLFIQTDRIIFDLTGVESITDSFADECYARLLEKFTKDDIEKKIHFAGVSPFVYHPFRKALRESKLNKKS